MATSTAATPLSPRALVSLERVAEHRGITIGEVESQNNKDEILTILINAVSQRVETITRRRLLRGEYTEYFDGQDHRFSVPVKAYPIQSVTNVWDDPNENYTSAMDSNTYSVDTDAGLVRMKRGANFSKAIRNIKVTYKGGYALYLVQPGVNDQIRVNDDGSTWATATILPSDKAEGYTAEELATEIKTRIEALSDFDDTITVTYDSDKRKFTIASDGSTFEILTDSDDANWDTRMGYFADLIGMTHGSGDTGKTGETSYEMDNPSGEVPFDLQWAVVEWVVFLYEQTYGGSNRFGVSGSGGGGQASGNVQYYLREPPKHVKHVIDSYMHGWL